MSLPSLGEEALRAALVSPCLPLEVIRDRKEERIGGEGSSGGEHQHNQSDQHWVLLSSTEQVGMGDAESRWKRGPPGTEWL